MGWAGLGEGGGVADSNKPILGEFLPSDQSLKNRLSAATLSEQNGHILESISFIQTKKGGAFPLCARPSTSYSLVFVRLIAPPSFFEPAETAVASVTTS